MKRQQDPGQTIPSLVRLMAMTKDEGVIYCVLNFICKTAIKENHDEINDCLKENLSYLPAKKKYADVFQEAIDNVRAKKEALEKTVTYEAILTLDEADSFLGIRIAPVFLHELSSTKISVSSSQDDPGKCRITISSDLKDYLDDDFGPDGLFQKIRRPWAKKFYRISGPPTSPKTD